MKKTGTFIIVGAALLGLGYLAGQGRMTVAQRVVASPAIAMAAAGTAMADRPSPVKPRARDFYAPNSEALGRNEMRVIACGTGMPTARPKQAASCFLLELGNGDKFLFDLGTGSADRLAALQIPYNYLDKVFISHLHTDHIGDIASLFVGGALAGRQKPLRIWGPSGATPEWGIAYAMEHLQKALTWDLDGRKGYTDDRGYHMDVTEFDYRGVNLIVYEDRGVTIRAWPAVHALDGPVSYAVEWKGLKFVFGGDTYPNKWYMQHARDADLAIHECFITVPQLIEKFQFTPQSALAVGTQIHTAPEAFGKVMSLVQPRMAVAYHFFNDYDTRSAIESGIRKTYDGPLSLATDYMVWNITKDAVRTRMMIVDENVWPPPATEKPLLPDASQRIPYSDMILDGKYDLRDVIQPIYDAINEQYGLDEKQE